MKLEKFALRNEAGLEVIFCTLGASIYGIRFHDEQKRLRLVVSSEAVLYIEAEENYVHIIHLDGGKRRDQAPRILWHGFYLGRKSNN